MPCPRDIIDANNCPDEPLEDVLNAVNYTFTKGKTAERTIQQPALRVETDKTTSW